MAASSSTEAALPARRRASADGRALSYREAGHGAPLLLLHGVGSNSGSFAAQLDGLSRHFRVIAWDAPGYGESDPHPDPKPVAAQFAEDLANLLDELGIRRAPMLGHSLGALVATSFAARWPDRVTALILSNPAVGYRAPRDAPLSANTAARVQDLLDLGPEGLAEKRAARTCGPAASPEVVAQTRALMAQIRAEGYIPANHLVAQGDIFADLPRVTAPVMVIAGSADPITPVEQSRRVADAANARWVLLEGAGHPCYAELPTAYNASVEAFVREVSS